MNWFLLYTYILYKAPGDYRAMSQLVTFQPLPGGLSSEQCIIVQIVDDAILEGVEMFFVEIQSTNTDVSLDPLSNRATIVVMNEDRTY